METKALQLYVSAKPCNSSSVMHERFRSIVVEIWIKADKNYSSSAVSYTLYIIQIQYNKVRCRIRKV